MKASSVRLLLRCGVRPPASCRFPSSGVSSLLISLSSVLSGYRKSLRSSGFSPHPPPVARLSSCFLVTSRKYTLGQKIKSSEESVGSPFSYCALSCVSQPLHWADAQGLMKRESSARRRCFSFNSSAALTLQPSSTLLFTTASI